MKQGNNLSPILFDILFDDVEEIFDGSCNPIKLPNGLSINHLPYADDIATLSFLSEGLQNSLNRLYTYCNKWKIEVCTVKTKILIFNTSGKLLKGYGFHYNDKIIEQDREFKYLGITNIFCLEKFLMCKKEKSRKQVHKSFFPLLN